MQPYEILPDKEMTVLSDSLSDVTSDLNFSSLKNMFTVLSDFSSNYNATCIMYNVLYMGIFDWSLYGDCIKRPPVICDRVIKAP